MPKFLTEQQIDQYHLDGFIAPIDVISAAQTAECLRLPEDVARRHPQHANAENRNNLHMHLPVSGRTGPPPDPGRCGGRSNRRRYRMRGSVMFIKEPDTNAYVSWHQDGTYMGMSSNDFVTPWIALTPGSVANGCMTMIAGRHRHAIVDHEDTFATDNILTRGQTIAQVDQSRPVDLILRAGQMSLHHSETVHGSQPNSSTQRRVGFALQAYMPSQTRQTIGKNIWQPIRGQQHPDNDLTPGRPQTTMDPAMLQQRQQCNDNRAEILYHGAQQRRAY